MTLSYGRRTVVRDASIELHPGTVTAFVGPNGSGKSTLLRGLAHLHRAAAGDIAFTDGTRLDELPSRTLAQRVTLLSQSRPTPHGVLVRDAVALGRHPYRGRLRVGDPEGAAVVERSMRLTGVHTLAEQTVDALSGGQLQRVWLASCLAQDTDVLLLDEPTNHLDLTYQVELLELLHSLAHSHGVCIGVVLHDLNHAAEIADHIVLLADGEIAARGAPADVLTSELLSDVYGIEITAAADPVRGVVEVRARPPRRVTRSPAIA